MTSPPVTVSGQCVCGDVRFRIAGALREVVYCHCHQCHKHHGAPAAFSASDRDALELDPDQRALSWYRSSTGVQRGFCCHCGTSLFWDDASRAYMAVSAAALAPLTPLAARAHIYTTGRPGFDTIRDDLPQFGAGLGGMT